MLWRMASAKEDIARQFGRMSRAYAASRTHAGGSDLERVVELLQPRPDMRVLDVATGAGHTAVAVAPHARQVVAIDLTPAMIERTRESAAGRGITNLLAMVMDVEALAFAGESFGAVVSRIAPHHFPNIRQAVAEITRVLKPGGAFVVEDNSVPDDREVDSFLNDAERLRDPTHVRAYTGREWRELLEAAGLRVAHSEVARKQHDFAEWLDRAGCGTRTKLAMYHAFARAPEAARRHLDIRYAGARAVSFTDDKVILRAERPA